MVITAKGQPDVATRLFLKKLKTKLQIPVLGLVDSDPYGAWVGGRGAWGLCVCVSEGGGRGRVVVRVCVERMCVCVKSPPPLSSRLVSPLLWHDPKQVPPPPSLTCTRTQTGLKILSVYMTGSKNMSYDSASLTTPDIKVRPSLPPSVGRPAVPPSSPPPSLFAFPH